jgi:hypothetical protein
VWLEAIGPFRVTKRESPRPGGQPYLPLSDPRALIVHTTEGTSVDGAWNTLNQKGAAPHFIVGENRIVQMRPLSAQAATLVTDSSAGFFANSLGWQVECVGRSLGMVHKLTPPSWEPLVALARWFHEQKDVPLRRPAGWLDNCSDITTSLATNNTRRQSRKALGFRGFLGHLDVPDQDPTWHWDPGALNYSALFRAVEEEIDVAFGSDLIAGSKRFREGKNLPADASPAFAFGYLQEKRIARAAKTPAPAEHSHPDLATGQHVHGPPVEP